jgi:hypothetical protein
MASEMHSLSVGDQFMSRIAVPVNGAVLLVGGKMGRGFPCGSPASLIEGDFRAEVLCFTEGLNLSHVRLQAERRDSVPAGGRLDRAR